MRRDCRSEKLAVPGVSYAYISRIEAGTRDPSLKALIKIAPKLDTTALYLLTGDESRCPVCGCHAEDHREDVLDVTTKKEKI